VTAPCASGWRVTDGWYICGSATKETASVHTGQSHHQLQHLVGRIPTFILSPPFPQIYNPVIISKEHPPTLVFVPPVSHAPLKSSITMLTCKKQSIIAQPRIQPVFPSRLRMPVWRNHKALSGSLVPGIFLLFVSLCGPFILRSIQRRRNTSRPSRPVEIKPSLMTTESHLKGSPEGSPGANGDIRQPNMAPSAANSQEIADYCAFIAQLPSPTLTFAPPIEQSPTTPAASTATPAPTAVTEGINCQRVYQEFLPSGDIRTVLEQQYDLGNGMHWRRKMVVYGGMEGSERPTTTQTTS